MFKAGMADQTAPTVHELKKNNRRLYPSQILSHHIIYTYINFVLLLSLRNNTIICVCLSRSLIRLIFAMGNAVVTPCFHQNQNSSLSIKLIFWEGTTRAVKGKHMAGEIMFEFPDKMVCHADSFFIGHPIPALGKDDELMPGQLYFVLPLDRLACKTLSASSLLSLGSHPNSKSTIKFGQCSFEYLKGSEGRMLIKVMPEFITRLINRGRGPACPTNNSFLCSTPELKKHYQQLVRSKDQVWSPKLETISEYNVGF